MFQINLCNLTSAAAKAPVSLVKYLIPNKVCPNLIRAKSSFQSNATSLVCKLSVHISMNPNVSSNAKYGDLVIQTSLIELKENIERVYIYGMGKYNDVKKFITWQFDKPISHSIKTLVVDADVYL